MYLLYISNVLSNQSHKKLNHVYFSSLLSFSPVSHSMHPGKLPSVKNVLYCQIVFTSSPCL